MNDASFIYLFFFTIDWLKLGAIHLHSFTLLRHLFHRYLLKTELRSFFYKVSGKHLRTKKLLFQNVLYSHHTFFHRDGIACNSIACWRPSPRRRSAGIQPHAFRVETPDRQRCLWCRGPESLHRCKQGTLPKG